MLELMSLFGTLGGVVDKNVTADFKNWEDSTWKSIKKGGRNINFIQTITVAYTLPIGKLPLLDWTSSSIHYNTTYN